MRGEHYYHADNMRTFSADKPRHKKSDQIAQLDGKKLVAYYLCNGKNSLCVSKGECPVLDKCRYGQRYLETQKDESEIKKNEKKNKRIKKIDRKKK